MPIASARRAWAPRSAAKNSDNFIWAGLFSDALIGVNSASRIPFFSASLPNRGVRTIDQIYRENLRLLVQEAGSQVKLAAKSGKSAAQISQWLNASTDPKTGKPRAMSRGTARELERACDKPEGWMERPHIDAPDGEADERASFFDRLTEDEHDMLLNFRQVTDKDRARVANQLAERAEELREYLAHQIPNLPVVAKHSSSKAARIARTTVETARTRTTNPRAPELPFDEED